VANVNGWSEESDTAYIYAFAAPQQPPAPTFAAGSDTSATLKFLPSRNDNGVRVSSYELFIDAGNDMTSAFRQITSYSTFLAQFTLTVETDALGAPGTLYRVKVRAVNKLNMKSEFSNDLVFRLGALPSQQNEVSKNSLLSGAQSIYIEWVPITTDTLPVLGYKLYADTGHNDDMAVIFSSGP
jgi:hypothetical protein